MIVEIVPELILGMLTPGSEIHVRVRDGIGPDYELAWARLGDNGNLVLGLKHKNDAVVNSAPYAPSFDSLQCGVGRSDPGDACYVCSLPAAVLDRQGNSYCFEHAPTGGEKP